MDGGSIDFVIAWVDGSDPAWQREKAAYTGGSEPANAWNDHPARYRDWDLLRYWFRGVEAFAPWVRKIHFVTWGHLPPWLNESHPKLHIVRHEEFIPQEYLPTFSSHCIELNLHRIKDLSDRFVYFNDDMFIVSPMLETDFFVRGLPRDTAALCPVQMVQNGIRAEINDLYVINRHFDKKRAMLAHPLKWFSPVYGGLLIKTLLLTPFRLFSGFYISHLPCAYLKSTFEAVWAAEREELDAACANRIRSVTDVNQWLMQYWQLAQGSFVPVSPRRGAMAEGQEALLALAGDIRRQRYQMVCLNDAIDIRDLCGVRGALADAFESILPQRSSFEKE